ncbi:MAG: trans-acting enoyl reductase family protein [Oligoflexales bacterium]
MQTAFDLVIYGATGFTGRLASQYLTQANKRDGLRIAIAGRNQKKLEAVQETCGKETQILIADSNRPETIDSMVQQTKVVLSFAGPFAIHGEPVIAGCVKHGRDYLDITGETPFIRSMVEKYQTEAERTGARLIPFCGFDSIPADLTVFLALGAAQSRGLQLDDMSLCYKVRGGLNGGTLASALNITEHKSGHDLFDPNILILDPSWPRTSREHLKPRYESVLSRWTAPFFMGPVNKAVVRRSSWLRAQQGKHDYPFEYEERMVMGSTLGILQAGLATGALAVLGLLAGTSTGRSLLRYIGPKPGEGPSDESRKNGFFRGQLICRSRSLCKLIVHMECDGDPGNTVTVALASESARLAAEGAFMPNIKGFVTPTIAFGDRLTTQLEKAGFRFRTEVC